MSRRPTRTERSWPALVALGLTTACGGGDPDDDVTFSGPSALAGSLDPTVGGRAIEDWSRDLTAADAATRYAALVALAEFSDAGAHRATIEPLVGDPVVAVRWAAIEVLGRLGEAQSAAVVVKAFDDPDRGVRRAAARAAGRIGSAAAPGLIARLDSSEDEARALVKSALVAIGPGLADHAADIGRRLMGDDPTLAEDAAEVLAAIGRAAVLTLAQAVADPRPLTSVTAAVTLGRMGESVGAAAVPALESVLSRRGDVRTTALDALARLGAVGRAALERAAASTDEALARAAGERLTAQPPK